MKESPIRDLARRLREVAKEHVAYSQVADFMNHIDNHLSALAYAEEVNQQYVYDEVCVYD
jgi:SLT domain-containing protein